MASNMSLFTSLFLLLLIFTQEIPSIHGRPFNLGDSNEPRLNETTKIVGHFNGENKESFPIAPPSNSVTGASQAPPPPPGHDSSDIFRPADSGNSPGAGHSVHN